MTLTRLTNIPALAAIAVLSTFLSACTTTPTTDGSGANDPFEDTNRAVHEFNKSVDSELLKPVSEAYGTSVPSPARTAISNFRSNLGLPLSIINNTLQFDIAAAAQNSARFLINSTVGVAGFFDPASRAEVYEAEADFGQTLSTWGMPEGPYVEWPFLGPSTGRDSVGTVMDFFIDPLGQIHKPESYYVRASTVGKTLDTRAVRGDAIDSVLYNSVDSYAQLRLIYLQNRRFKLGETPPVDPELDLFWDEDFED